MIRVIHSKYGHGTLKLRYRLERRVYCEVEFDGADYRQIVVQDELRLEK